MKTVKSLLLGTAAAVVTMAGANAADLRAAAPVQFVQVCDAAGAGFWVIPGTDVCVSVNGTISMGVQVVSGNFVGTPAANGQLINNLRLQPFNGVAGSLNNGVLTPNVSPSTQFFANGRIQTRSFQRTDIGIIRTTINIQGDSPFEGGTTVGLRQAWVSVTNTAGVFTAGLTESWFAPAGGVGILSGVTNAPTNLTSGLGATNGTIMGNEQGSRRVAFAYTAVLAPNVTATLAIEQNAPLNTSNAILGGTGLATPGGLNATHPGFGGPAFASGINAGQSTPAIVANVMLGTTASGNFFALSGAVVDNGGFFAGTRQGNAAGQAIGGTGAQAGAVGWAVAAMLGLNADAISRGSRFGARFAYSDGATQYLGNGLTGNGWIAGQNSAGITPGTYRNVAGWAAAMAYSHQWNAQWRTALYAGVTAMNYRGNAAFAEAGIAGGNIFAGITPTSFMNTGNGATGNSHTTLVGWNGTNLVRSGWQVGTTTMWTPVTNFSVALDVAVTQARYTNTFGGGASGMGNTRTGWSTILGVRRDF